MTRIRPARPEDRTAIETIQSTVLADPTPALVPTALHGPMPGLVAVTADDVPVGYLIAMIGEGQGYVAELAVAPDAQGQGVGSALLSAACRKLRESGADRVRVTARAIDERARTFYENRGFERVDRLADHYVDDVDGIVYERALA